MFALEQQTELVRCIQEAASNHVGIAIKVAKDSISLDTFLSHKFGKYRYEWGTLGKRMLLGHIWTS